MNKNLNYTFDTIRIVMVNTTEAGNIGAAARAMKNMALSNLYLVNPQNYPSAAATARASNADDILAKARVCKSLAEAVADCQLTIGTSLRKRNIKWQQTDVVNVCNTIIKTVNKDSKKQKIAIVFGSETSGLSNDELDLCQILMTIPSNADYPSLNLAQAVQIFSYQLYLKVRDDATSANNKSIETLPTNKELQHFYRHLDQVLKSIGYTNYHRPDKLIIRRLRNIFNRTQLYKDEVAIMRGILTKIKKYK